MDIFEYTENRVKLYKDYNKYLDKIEYYKDRKLGQGAQGTVSLFVKKNGQNEFIVIKKSYLKKKESKFLNKVADPKALKIEFFIEIEASTLINQLVVQDICPNFVLNYSWSSKEREGICWENYPYSVNLYNEYLNGVMTFGDWVTKSRTEYEWYNIYFQIITALYALQKYFKMIHLDFHSENVLILPTKKGGFWKYTLNSKDYYLPNLGFMVLLNDFGHAYISKKLISGYQVNKKKHFAFDLIELTSSIKGYRNKTIKKKIDKLISILKKDTNVNIYIKVIEELFYELFNKKPINTEQIIGKYSLDKKIKQNFGKYKLLVEKDNLHS